MMKDETAQEGLDKETIRLKIVEHTNRFPIRPIRIVSDTSEFMAIEHGDVVVLGGKAFLVLGNAHEGRFGLDEQPKFWVKRAIDLNDGRKKIIKLMFSESTKFKFGPFVFKCVRSGAKESQLLELARGDLRFMQGYTVRDEKQNIVRVIDLIPGPNLYDYLASMYRMPHEEYFFQHYPALLKRMVSAIEGIKHIHEKGMCHGDIRVDHIIVDRETGDFRWIDFDLQQHSLDFDVWSMGNAIIFLAGKGEVTFHGLRRGDYGAASKFDVDDSDASAFFPHRIANIRRVYPYIPEQLNNIFVKYTKKAQEEFNHYKSIFLLHEDIKDFVECWCDK
ncbi:MAG: hypothetical protein ABIJ56_22450 [Pseudomonadota bacterium]